jgi:DNA-binding SARP family transcriptional activator
MTPRSIRAQTGRQRGANAAPTLREITLMPVGNPCYKAAVEIRILGPLDVLGDDGATLRLTGNRQRALLVALALRPGIVVPTEQLVEEIWGAEAPRTAVVSLQNGISALRKVLGPDVVVTRPPGYLLDVERDAVDAYRFERLVAEARRVPPEARRALVDRAMSLWRGPPLAELTFAEFAQSEIRRLEELRLAAQEVRIAADVESGRAADVIAELEALTAEHPLREEPRRLQMLALYRAGRQAEALAVFQSARAALVDELGIEPGPALRDLHAAILRHEVPGASASAATADVEAEMIRALAAGRVVPVLGLDRAGELAASLARTFGLSDEHPVDLARVSQQVATLNGSGPLHDELHERFQRATEPTALHRFLASLPAWLRERGQPHPLIVSTCYDLGLEQALADAGEELDVVSYGTEGAGPGRFWHRPHGGEPVRIDVPNTYVTELALDRRTVLLRLQGMVDPSAARAWESFVVTEDDYITYLGGADVTGALPVSITATLRRSHFLFLGYEVADWGLRLLLGRIWGGVPVAYRSWAVHERPSPLLEAFWRRYDVQVVDADPVALCDGVRVRMEGA